MEQQHHLEALKIHSSHVQSLPPDLLAGVPPFRAPHHQASAAAVMGLPDTPGELSLAHGGILFLDEFPEFRRDLIEALREPLETGRVSISRARRKIVWNCEITLIAACNSCPCGWLGSKRRKCVCPTPKILAYRRRLSGPILDRIDLHVNMMEDMQSRSDLFLQLQGMKDSKHLSQTEDLGEQVFRARQFARERNRAFGLCYNRDLQADHLIAASGLASSTFQALVDTVIPSSSGKRSVIRSLRVARTLADLDERAAIEKEDLQQACKWLADACAKERGDKAYGL
jgi:magnesium chelatase family protein